MCNRGRMRPVHSEIKIKPRRGVTRSRSMCPLGPGRNVGDLDAIRPGTDHFRVGRNPEVERL